MGVQGLQLSSWNKTAEWRDSFLLLLISYRFSCCINPRTIRILPFLIRLYHRIILPQWTFNNKRPLT